MADSKPTETEDKKPPNLSEQLKALIKPVCGEGKRYSSRTAFSRVLRTMEKRFDIPDIEHIRINVRGLSPDQLALLQIMLEPVGNDFREFEKRANQDYIGHAGENAKKYADLAINEARDFLEHTLIQERELPSEARIAKEVERLAAEITFIGGNKQISPEKSRGTAFGELTPDMQAAIIEEFERIQAAGGMTEDARDKFHDFLESVLRGEEALASKGRVADKVERLALESPLVREVEAIPPRQLREVLFSYLSTDAQDKLSQEFRIIEQARRNKPTDTDFREFFTPPLLSVLQIVASKRNSEYRRDKAATAAMVPARECISSVEEIAASVEPADAPKRLKPTTASQEVAIKDALAVLDSDGIRDDELVRLTCWKLFKELLAHTDDPAAVVNKVFSKGMAANVLEQAATRMSDPQDYMRNHPELADKFVEAVGVKKSLQPVAVRCLFGIPFQPKDNLMPQILEYAQHHQEFSAREAFEAAALNARFPVSDLKKFSTRVLKLSDAEHNRFLPAITYGSKAGTPSATLVDKVGAAMGCRNDKEQLLWRQLVAGVRLDPNHHQNEIDACFAGTPTLIRHRVNMNETRLAQRKKTLEDFFTLLEKAYGFQSHDDLAEHIAATQPDSHAAQELGRSVKRLFAQINNAVTLPPAHAELVANFAFPGKKRLQTQCVEFLSAEKYEQAAAAERAKKKKNGGQGENAAESETPHQSRLDDEQGQSTDTPPLP